MPYDPSFLKEEEVESPTVAMMTPLTHRRRSHRRRSWRRQRRRWERRRRSPRRCHG
jgi:inosine/xanthosine triphosphate pyrophosphatase family protein